MASTSEDKEVVGREQHIRLEIRNSTGFTVLGSNIRNRFERKHPKDYRSRWSMAISS